MTTLPPELETALEKSLARQEKKRRRNRLSCIALIVLGTTVLLAFYFFCLHVPRLRISETTTRVTGPLRKDGQIDFLKAVEAETYPPEMKTDENGYRIFVRTFGDVATERKVSPSWKKHYRERKYEKLGLDPDEAPSMVLPLDPTDIVNNHFKAKGESVPDKRRTITYSPWTLEDEPLLADWVAEMEEPLDALAEMIRKPVFFPPLIEEPETAPTGLPQNLPELMIPDVQFLRSLARQFQARANYRIAAGNIDGAIDDVVTLLHLGRKTTQGAMLTQYLVGTAIEGVGHAIPIGANAEHPPSAEQLQRFLEEIDALPPRAPIETAYQWERLSTLSAVQHTFQTEYPALRFFCNQNTTYRQVNEWFDSLTGLAPREKLDDFENRLQEARDRWPLRALTSSGRGRIAADCFGTLCMPALDAFEEAERRDQCVLNMKRLTLALLIHETRRGTTLREDKNWIEAIRPILGDSLEDILRCPSSRSTAEGSTVALVRYARLPENRDAVLLLEMNDPTPFDEAHTKPGDVLIKMSRQNSRNKFGSEHPGGFYSGHRDGSVRFQLFDKLSKNPNEFRRLFGFPAIPEKTTGEQTEENVSGDSLSEPVISEPEN